jgi:endonuclease YncB( thermonuclease family)
MNYGPYPALVLDWHDGDTCHLNLDLGFGVILSGYDTTPRPVISCRVAGINAPELSDPDGSGQEAAAYARQLAPPGTRVTVVSHGWDKYGGRFDGSLTLPDGSSFGERMIEAGKAVAISG